VVVFTNTCFFAWPVQDTSTLRRLKLMYVTHTHSFHTSQRTLYPSVRKTIWYREASTIYFAIIQPTYIHCADWMETSWC